MRSEFEDFRLYCKLPAVLVLLLCLLSFAFVFNLFLSTFHFLLTTYYFPLFLLNCPASLLYPTPEFACPVGIIPLCLSSTSNLLNMFQKWSKKCLSLFSFCFSIFTAHCKLPAARCSISFPSLYILYAEGRAPSSHRACRGSPRRVRLSRDFHAISAWSSCGPRHKLHPASS